jgi:histidinol phosphatase-like enzyme (inositol monophosphatase family)
MSNRDHDHLELEGFALELGHTAGGIAKAYFRSSFSIDNKDQSGFDPVTSADHAIEQVLRETIRETYPDHGIVAEEAGNEEASSEYTWYIDPIDGTRAFLMGSPLWGTLVGLVESGKPLVGLLVQPVLGELFFGSPSGSWLITEEGRSRLRTSGCDDIKAASLACTHPSMFGDDDRAGFERVAERVLLNRFGGDCYNYAMLAAGFVDLVVEAGLKPFDIVPLIPIIEGAGGVVTDWSGGSPFDGGRVVAAANASLHAQALEQLNG